MKEFTDEMRYEYPALTPESVVLDLGCYKGDFSDRLHDKYHSFIYAFEPVKEFYDQCVWRLARYPKVAVFNFGVGGFNRSDVIHVQNDSSGIFGHSTRQDIVEINSIADVLYKLGLNMVDLMKVNIEGMEFELLEFILAKGLAPRFRNIQVQFHPVIEEPEMRYHTIKTGLLKTHRLTYCKEFCWENYKLL